jgi:hypothetical protein
MPFLIWRAELVFETSLWLKKVEKAPGHMEMGPGAHLLTISYIYVFLQLQTFSYVLRLVFRNVLSYEFPAGYLLLHSFF